MVPDRDDEQRRAAGSRSFCSRRRARRAPRRRTSPKSRQRSRIPRRRGSLAPTGADGRQGQSRPETSSKNAERGFPKRETFLGKRIAEGPAVSPVRREARADPLERGAARASPRAGGGRGDGEDETGDPAIVSCDVVADRVTGLGRGFAFVRMRDARLAARVVAALDGANVEGRAIVVRVAEDKRRTKSRATEKARRDARTRRSRRVRSRRVRFAARPVRATGRLRESVRALRPPCSRRRRGGGGRRRRPALAAAAAGMAARARIRRSRRTAFTRRRIFAAAEPPAPRHPTRHGRDGRAGRPRRGAAAAAFLESAVTRLF